jgi:hypothetical protein
MLPEVTDALFQDRRDSYRGPIHRHVLSVSPDRDAADATAASVGADE